MGQIVQVTSFLFHTRLYGVRNAFYSYQESEEKLQKASNQQQDIRDHDDSIPHVEKYSQLLSVELHVLPSQEENFGFLKKTNHVMIGIRTQHTRLNGETHKDQGFLCFATGEGRGSVTHTGRSVC